MADLFPKPLLYIYPGALFPRRVTVYIAEASLQSTIVTIPIRLTSSGVAIDPDFASYPNPPPGSLPILSLGPTTHITQSNAILEYLEEVHGGLPAAQGLSPLQRANVRCLNDIANEATTFFTLYTKNASLAYAGRGWDQVPEVARAALDRLHQLLTQLEGMAVPAKEGKDGSWLCGTSGPTIADCVLYALLEFALEGFGIDLVEGHERLKGFVLGWKGRASEDEGFGGLPEAMSKKAKELSVR